MRVTLLGPRKLTTMHREERLWMVYTHACLQFANHEHLTNVSLRKRLSISPGSSSQVSRLISDALNEGLIKLFDDTAGTKSRSYIPFWV